MLRLPTISLATSVCERGGLPGEEVPVGLFQALEASLRLQLGWVPRYPGIAEYQKRFVS